MNSSPWLGLLVVLTTLAGGCSSIPSGDHAERDPALLALGARSAPVIGSLGVAPLTSFTLSEEEAAKGWSPRADVAFRGVDFDRALRGALEASGSYQRVRLMASGTVGEAYDEQDDFVLRLRVRELQTTFEGRNGWWIPNIVNWLFWMVPAWWVATEDFSLQAEAELQILSAESGAVLGRERIEAKVVGSFDEFDRGWHFFGFVYTPLDPDRWLRVASRLFPALRSQLVVAATLRADALLRRVTSSKDYTGQRRKILVTTLGLSRYGDAHGRPDLPFAAGDGKAVREAIHALGIDASRTQGLYDGAASVANVRSSLAAQLGRARAGDDVFVFFSGYGSRSPSGDPLLLLQGSGKDGGELSLQSLLDELATYPGRKLVVVDASFDSGQRAIRGGGTPRELKVPPGVSLLLGCSAGEPTLASEYLGHGLLTHCLLRALKAPESDLNGDQRLDARELFSALQGSVVAESALLGAQQEPRLWAEESANFSFPFSARKETR